MAEYIDREAAIKAMENADCALIADYAESCKADYLREIIESVPAADVVPVAHGTWIEKTFLMGTSNFCSLCGCHYGMPHEKYRYCPNCGARMDGGADND